MGRLRDGLEYVSRKVIFKRSLSERFGCAALAVSPGAGLRFYKLRVEDSDPFLLRAARQTIRPGNVVWDIGANVGVFMVAASALSGPKGTVLAVDADGWLANLLRSSVKLRNEELQSRMEVLCCAISDSVGVAQFCIARRARAANHLSGFGTDQSGGLRAVQSVLSVSLDWLSTRRPGPNVLKIDVEGAERNLIDGSLKVLELNRPTVIIEVGPANAIAVTDRLRSLNYELFDGDHPVRVHVPGIRSRSHWNA